MPSASVTDKKPADSTTSQMIPHPELDLFTWHFTQGIPSFTTRRLKHINDSFAFFNFWDLLKHFFTPYRRMVAKEKTTLADRISFDLISIFVGAGARLTLILAGILGMIGIVFFNLASIGIYSVLPILSIFGYVKYKESYFFASDTKSPNKFLKKLLSSPLTRYLAIYFEDDFQSLLSQIPAPSTVKITPGTPTEVILALLANWPPLTKYLQSKGAQPKHFEFLVNHIRAHLENPPIAKTKPLGQVLAFGYTNTLDKFGTDLTQKSLPLSYVNKELLAHIEKTLNRPQNNNVLLVGEPGVGRHTFLENLAAAIQRQALPTLAGRRIIFLDTIALLGASKNLLEVKSNFEAILQEAKRAGNIILTVDQIDRITSNQEGRIDVSEVINAILTDNSLPTIGITTPDEFNQFIRPNASFLNLFEKVDVAETTEDETIFIVIGKALNIYLKEKIKVLFGAILEIIDKSSRLVSDRKQPEKSILLLEDAVAEAKIRSASEVSVALVDEIIAQKTKTPVGKISQSEAEKLKNLESILHKRIVSQNEAIEQIARAMRRARAGIEIGNRPIGSFLFLGPTGVGKTETAKALAEAYFGSENKMVRLDMPEFTSADSLKRLIGDLTAKTQGQLANLIRENPYGLLLLDEFEKAHSDVHDLFLQVLDEGFLTDAFGKKVSFDNIIIIATSNAGAEFIREEVKKGTGNLSKRLLEYVLQKGLFNPELLNRFDAVVVYHPLTQEEVIQVSMLMLTDLANRLKNSKNITLEITAQLAAIIAQKGFDPTFGARPIRRLIADKIEDGVAKLIIAGQVTSGSTIPAATLLQFVA